MKVFVKEFLQSNNDTSIFSQTNTMWSKYQAGMTPYKLDGIIYVKTTPDICLKRIEKRNRKGEETIPLCYLANCHSFHEKWIKNTNVPILFVDGNREGVAADTILKINDFVKNN